jgi:hypothetical protein
MSASEVFLIVTVAAWMVLAQAVKLQPLLSPLRTGLRESHSL